jgi:hypothetical protein
MSEPKEDMRKLSASFGWEYLGDRPDHPIFQEGYTIHFINNLKKPTESSRKDTAGSASPKSLERPEAEPE